jgi:hypothetical protein
VATSDASGWWALDVAGYLLTPLDHLCGLHPSKLDREDAIDWIRKTELPWAPGRADLDTAPWDELAAKGTEVELVETVLQAAAAEAQAAASADGDATGALQLTVRRRALLSTLEAFTDGGICFPRIDGPTADPHVHQGAALPLEVTLHWVAGQITSIARHDPDQHPVLLDSKGEEFYALPLMLALPAVLDGHPAWREALALAERATRPEGAEEWSRLNELVSFEGVHTAVRDRREIVDLKREAIKQWGDPARYIALFRLEGVLQGSVMQTEPGLDVFVRAFEGLASVRRRRFEKTEYYRRAITVYLEESRNLVASEMRLGEPVFPPQRPQEERPSEVSALASEYLAALQGYAKTAGSNACPVAISFPLGMVKTKGGRTPPENWRFDPTVIYQLTETLIELLGKCRALTRFVDGLDVCGKEDDAPNWLFAPAYSRFAHWAAKNDRPTTLRFHAGEWQSTPVHGLRRIAEFLAFDVPPGTSLRVGHGLALDAHDWSGLPEQRVDEVLDDCVWSYKVLSQTDSPPEVLRMLERAVVELWPSAYPGLERPSMKRIVKAYAARQDPKTLSRIGFLAREEGTLTFGGGEPAARPGSDDALVVAHLKSRPAPVPTLRDALAAAEKDSRDVEQRVSLLRLALSDVYEELVAEVREDLRWRRVIVEVCPTSNVIVGGVRGYRRHPAVSFLQHGGLVTVGTDDPSLFHTWTAHEVEISHQFVGISRGQMRRSQDLAVATVAAGMPREDIPDRLKAAIGGLTEIARDTA